MISRLPSLQEFPIFHFFLKIKKIKKTFNILFKYLIINYLKARKQATSKSSRQKHHPIQCEILHFV